MIQIPFRIVGFDLDGTLVDTSADLAASVNHALAMDRREPLPFARLCGMIGGGARHLLAQALAATGGYDDTLLDRLHAALTDHYAAHLADRSLPYPGAVAALDALAAADVRLAVVTNKLERFAVDLLTKLGLDSRFATIIGGDTLPQRKPSPEPITTMIARLGGGRAAFVGDSAYDVRAARAAGVPVVACAFGFLTEPVDTLGADAAIDGFNALLPALASL